MRKITIAEIGAFDGKEGRETYVAYEGKVYDLSGSKKWIQGKHMGRHSSGTLISNEIEDAPHGPEVLEKFPVVGEVAEEAPAGEPLSAGRPSLRERVKPLEWPIKHGHPMTVHYPIAFMMAATFFVLLYMLTGHRPFETASYYLMTLGLIATPVAVATGLITWWYNYQAEIFYIIRRKMQLSVMLFLVGLVMVFWRCTVPDVLVSHIGLHWLYLILTLMVTPLVALLGYYGGKLTFGS